MSGGKSPGNNRGPRLLDRITVVDATYGVLLFNLTYRWSTTTLSKTSLGDDQNTPTDEECTRLAALVKVFHQVSRSTFRNGACQRVSFGFSSLASPQQQSHIAGNMNMTAPARVHDRRRGRASVSFLAPNLSLPRRAKAKSKPAVMGLSTACNPRFIVGVFYDKPIEAADSSDTDKSFKVYAESLVREFESEYSDLLESPIFHEQLKAYVQLRERNEAPNASPITPSFMNFKTCIDSAVIS
eukprot:CFRG2489T1